MLGTYSQRCGVAAGVCTDNDSHEIGAKSFIVVIKKPNADMDIPDKIQGISEGDNPHMVKCVEKEAAPLYPAPKLMTRKELSAFYYEIGDKNEKN